MAGLARRRVRTAAANSPPRLSGIGRVQHTHGRAINFTRVRLGHVTIPSRKCLDLVIIAERAGPILNGDAFCYLDQFALQVGSRLRNPNRTRAPPTFFVRVCRQVMRAGLWEALVAPCTGSRIPLILRVLRWSLFGTLTVVRIRPMLVALIDSRETVFAPVRAAQARWASFHACMGNAVRLCRQRMPLLCCTGNSAAQGHRAVP